MKALIPSCSPLPASPIQRPAIPMTATPGMPSSSTENGTRSTAPGTTHPTTSMATLTSATCTSVSPMNSWQSRTRDMPKSTLPTGTPPARRASKITTLFTTARPTNGLPSTPIASSNTSTQRRISSLSTPTTSPSRPVSVAYRTESSPIRWNRENGKRTAP